MFLNQIFIYFSRRLFLMTLTRQRRIVTVIVFDSLSYIDKKDFVRREHEVYVYCYLLKKRKTQSNRNM